MLISSWLVLAIIISLLARENLSVPGLNYDEAIFAGMVKDFLTGQTYGQHMRGNEVIEILGRPFPLFVQGYLGALKCWMLMPSFRLFGFSVAVLRSANLFWGLLALLFLMLGTWRWLGLRTALIGGALLAFDATYFFLCLWDWGAAVPSFVCRCLCFYLAAVWWQRRQAPYAFLAAFFAGLGFFNKIDFAVLLIAVAVAGAVCFGRPLLASLRSSISTVVFAAVGFLLGAGPMLFKIPKILATTSSRTNPSSAGEFGEKLVTLSSLYDGSHFYQLMMVGGVFEKMFAAPLHWLPIFGAGVAVAGVVCVAQHFRSASMATRAGMFFLLASALVTLGMILLPDAIRIHHAVLVYPLPHVLIAVAASLYLETPAGAGKRRLIQATTWVALVVLLLSGLRAIYKTQGAVRETGGRGRWSESFDRFCLEHRNRTDLTIMSLDWGFHEQLMFLTEGPRLKEPFWDQASLPTERNYLYVVYPPEYSVFPLGSQLLSEAQNSGAGVEVRPYFDRQNRAAFYTIQFPRR